MRQESAFNARAMSPVGAAGLMQLMPNTAGAVAGDRSLRSKRSRHKLFAPEYNIDLGQRYLQTLLKMPMVNGNLMYLAAARSEEHTSELQSLMRISYAVFCLKKKNIHMSTRLYIYHKVVDYTYTEYQDRQTHLT